MSHTPAPPHLLKLNDAGPHSWVAVALVLRPSDILQKLSLSCRRKHSLAWLLTSLRLSSLRLRLSLYRFEVFYAALSDRFALAIGSNGKQGLDLLVCRDVLQSFRYVESMLRVLERLGCVGSELRPEGTGQHSSSTALGNFASEARHQADDGAVATSRAPKEVPVVAETF